MQKPKVVVTGRELRPGRVHVTFEALGDANAIVTIIQRLVGELGIYWMHVETSDGQVMDSDDPKYTAKLLQ
jgi:hypothetical protein